MVWYCLRKKEIAMMNHPFFGPRVPSITPAAACADIKPSASPHSDKLRPETGSTAPPKTYSDFAEEAEFVNEMEDQLGLLNRNLDQLAAKIAGSSDAILAAARPKLQALRHQAAELNRQLEDARSTAESTRKSIHVGSWMAGAAPQPGPDRARL
jgi:hypothetical protein